MAFRLIEGAEPIPGYQLQKRLGTGGYGEVWLASAPGELAKAIKVIYGHKHDARAEQEKRALSRIKGVHHPFILSLERFEFIEDQLFIVTELAEGNLMERFEECRRAGLGGIPRQELLGYLRDTADALDFMNEKYGLQHLDIKPQNLLLIGGHVKVADFGLVKDLQGTSATATGGVTPLYASPEAFDGKISRFSDQYSLAIVYQEMLTGFRPFPGRTALQLANQHMNSPPLLDPLPPGDRPIIGRALAKVADQRFPTCRELVELLVQASAPPPLPSAPPPPTGLSPVRKEGSRARENLRDSPRPPDYGDHEILDMDTIASPEQIPRVNTRPPPVAPRPREAPRPLTAITPPKEVKLRPTLFLGLGGLAGWTLRRLRRRLQRRFGDLAAVPILRLLLLDTDRASLSSAHPEEPGESPSLDETLLVPLRKNDHYRQESRELLRWLDRNFLYGIPRSLQTEGYRPLGRLALVDNLPLVMDRLREVLSALTDREALAATRSATGLSLREETPRVFLVAGISGGTGSGMVLDMAFAVKQVLAELRLSEEGVCGLLLHGTCADLDLTQKLRARANAYATLTELNHFSKPGICYPGDPQHGLAAFGPEDYPFEECYLVHLGEELNEVQAEGAADFLAEYLYLDAATTVGSFLDPYRLSTHTAPFHPGLDTPLRTLGLDRLCFPRHNLAEEAGRLLCHRIVTRWQGKLEEGADVQIQEEAVRQAEAVGLEGEALARELVGAVETFWREDPETYLQNQLIRWQLDPLPSRAAPNSPEQIQWLLRKIDDLLPEGQDLGLGLKAPQDSLEGALRAQADELAESRCQGIVQWLTTLVEDPQQRLKAADAALRGLLRHLSGMAESLRGQLGDCRGSRETLRQRLSNGEPIGKGGGGRWLNLGRRQGSAGDPNQKFLEYGWLRLKEILLENVAEVLRLVSRRLGELVQELSLARQKLEHFAAAFTPADHTAEGPAPLPNLTELLPDQCRTLGEAGRLLFQRLEGKLGRELDETFQAEVLGPQGGLWGLVAKTWDLNEGLKNDLHRRAQAALLENLKEVDAARLFLEAHPDPDRAKEVLLSHVLTAAPKLITSQGWQHLVASLPPGPAGDQLRDLVSRECAPTPTTLLESEGDLLFLYEVAHLPLQKLAAELIEHASTLHEVSRKVMTRIDVKWSYLTLNEE